jgi:hypothetical protein
MLYNRENVGRSIRIYAKWQSRLTGASGSPPKDVAWRIKELLTSQKTRIPCRKIWLHYNIADFTDRQ